MTTLIAPKNTYTEEQLRTFTDEQIIEVFKPREVDFIDATCDWTHTEYIFIAVYDEVIEDKLTQSDKDKWMEEFKDRFDDELDFTLTYDELMEENEWLREDVGCDEWNKPENINECLVYMFRFMMEQDFYTEAFVDFINGVE